MAAFIFSSHAFLSLSGGSCGPLDVASVPELQELFQSLDLPDFHDLPLSSPLLLDLSPLPFDLPLSLLSLPLSSKPLPFDLPLSSEFLPFDLPLSSKPLPFDLPLSSDFLPFDLPLSSEFLPFDFPLSSKPFPFDLLPLLPKSSFLASQDFRCQEFPQELLEEGKG